MNETSASDGHRRLMTELRAGFPDSPEMEAFEEVPRHVFLPDVSLDEAHSNKAITTSHAAGLATSSCSKPSWVAMVIGLAQVSAGQRVLEIGSGTGYSAAQSRFTQAEQAAQDAYDAATQAASSRQGNAFGVAQSEYNAAIAAAHPTIDLAAEQANYSRILADALQRYNDMVAHNNTAFDDARDEAQAELDRVSALIESARQVRENAANEDEVPNDTRRGALAAAALYDAYHRADVQLRFQRTIEQLEHRRDTQNADALLIYEQSKLPIEHEYNTLRTRHDHFIEERRIIADQRLVQTRAQAAKQFARDTAAAEQTRSVALAVAENIRTRAITKANATSWKDDAAAKKLALDRWSSGHGGLWQHYQAKLAAHEQTYVVQMADQRVAYSTAVANATLDEARTIASAVRRHDNEEAQAVYDRTKEQSAAARDRRLDENDNDFDIEGRDIFHGSRAANWKEHRAQIVVLEADYTKAVADVQLVHDLAVADANHALAYVYGDLASAFIMNNCQGSYGQDAISINGYHAWSVATETARELLETAKLELEGDRLDATYQLQNYLDHTQLTAAQTQKLKNADLVSEYETAVGEAQRDYTIDLATIAATRDNTIAAATTQWWDRSSFADETYVVAEAGLARDRVIDDAESLCDFQKLSAMQYALQVAAWGGGTPDIPFECPAGFDCSWFTAPPTPVRPSDPWKAYQLDLATAEYYRVRDSGNASVGYVTSVANAEVGHTTSVAAPHQLPRTTALWRRLPARTQPMPTRRRVATAH